MNVNSHLDSDLLDDIMETSNIIYTNRGGESWPVEKILGSDDPKEVWVLMNDDALNQIYDMYLSDDISLDQFEKMVEYVLDIRGDPKGVFDW